MSKENCIECMASIGWLEKEIIKQEKAVQYAKSGCSSFGMYEDCGSYYQEEYIEAKAKLATLIYVKNSLMQL